MMMMMLERWMHGDKKKMFIFPMHLLIMSHCIRAKEKEDIFSFLLALPICKVGQTYAKKKNLQNVSQNWKFTVFFAGSVL